MLLVEADPAGGTLAAGSGWPPEPSLVSLAAAARRGGEPSLVWDHCQQLPGGAAVLAGPSLDRARPHRARRCSARCWAVSVSSTPTCWWTAAGSTSARPPRRLWERADRVVLAVRPRLADLHALADLARSPPVRGAPSRAGDGG